MSNTYNGQSDDLRKRVDELIKEAKAAQKAKEREAIYEKRKVVVKKLLKENE